MSEISNLDDAAGKVLSIYHDLKSKRKDKKQNLLKKAIQHVWEIWGKAQKYELETFSSIMHTTINSWKPKKKKKAVKNGQQLTLFKENTVKKAIKKIKKVAGYECLTFATH